MTVYVDDMYLYEMGQFKRGGRTYKMSHMIADTDDELHAMADKIGVQRRWHQAPPKHDSHYDVTMTMRAKAIAAGAVAITLRELSCMAGFRRVSGGDLPNPAEAESKYAELRRINGASS